MQKINQEIVNKEVSSIKHKIAKIAIEKTKLLLELNIPKEWTLKEQEIHKIYNETKPTKSEFSNNKKSKERFKLKKDSSEISQNQIINFFKSDISPKDISDNLELSWVNGYKRSVGLSILGTCLNSHVDEISNCIQWFIKSLRPHASTISSYCENIEGCGYNISSMVRDSFFECIKGIVYQLRTIKDLEEETIELCLQALIWKYDISDHGHLLRSKVIDVLIDGNGIEDKEKNKIKYKWGHHIYEEDKVQPTAVHGIMNTFECIVFSIFSKVNLGSCSEDSKQDGILNLDSVTETNSNTEGLIAKCFEVVFEQLNRYVGMIQSFNAIDWKLFVNKRNAIRKSGIKMEFNEEDVEFDDEITRDEKEHRQEEENIKTEELEKQREESAKGDNSDPRDHINEII